MIIRDATTDDVDAICALAAERRHIYQGYEPRFWRVAANAREVNEPWIAWLVGEESVVSLVAEDDGGFAGFLIATVGPTPPVYDPGGLTAMIDDFAVVSDAAWATTGRDLLGAATARA